MQTVVVALMLLVSFGFVLKQSFLSWKWVAGIAVVAALWVGFSWPWAIEQSKMQIADWLSNPALMADTAVLLTVEVALQMAFCIVEATYGTQTDLPRRKKLLLNMLRCFPGLLFFVVLFSLLVGLIYALPGVSFPLVAWSLAGAVLLLVPALVWLLRKLLPETSIRLELLFLVNALMAALGIVATVNGRTAVEGIDSVSWSALAGLAGMVAAFAFIGWTIRKITQNKASKLKTSN